MDGVILDSGVSFELGRERAIPNWRITGYTREPTCWGCSGPTPGALQAVGGCMARVALEMVHFLAYVVARSPSQCEVIPCASPEGLGSGILIMEISQAQRIEWR